MSKVAGYIVKNMPDFYFIPVFVGDEIFSSWESPIGSWRCPRWASDKKLEVIPLRACTLKEVPSCWVIVGYGGTFDEETAESAISNGKQVIPCVELEKLV